MARTSHLLQISLNQWLNKLRIPLIIAGLGLITFFTFYVAFFVPPLDFIYVWQPDSVFKVEDVSFDWPSASSLMAGDIILTIDGQPARWANWTPLFAPQQDEYQITLMRNGETITTTLHFPSLDLNLISERLTAGLVSLLNWFVAALVILFAPPRNRAAWQLGLATLLSSMVLAASEAALYNVPGAWLLSNPFYAVCGIALAHVAMLPRITPPSKHERVLFRVLYCVAFLIGAFSVWELVYLVPRGSSIELLTGISSYNVQILWLAFGALAHIVILAWRYTRISDSYQRRQLLIILVFTTAAILPLALFTIMPLILFGAPAISWNVSIAFIALVPAGYAFVIYRRNYLRLDVFVTSTMTWLFLSVAIWPIYAVIYYLLKRQFGLDDLTLLPAAFVFFLFWSLLPGMSRRMRNVVEWIINGPSTLPLESQYQITARLSDNPQLSTLKEVAREVTTFLQVRQMALLLVDRRGWLIPVDNQRVEQSIMPVSQEDLVTFTDEILLRQHYTDVDIHYLFKRYPWVDCFAPLIVGDALVGMMMLGSRVPDGYFNGQQVAYLRQVTKIIAVASETVRLFEASQRMAGKLLRVRDSERLQLASLIHNDPLQRISLVTSGLHKLAETIEISKPLAPEEISSYGRELQGVNKTLRDICAGLHPPVLKQGAQWAVKEAAYEFRSKSNVEVHLNMVIAYAVLVPYDLTIAVYSILLEALNNVSKHAQADNVWITLTHVEKQLILSIEDDGVYSLISSLPLPTLIRRHHFGIAGMYERAKMVNGDLTVEQREGGGTAVTLKIPFIDEITSIF